jgi:hypothetical protein
VAVAADPAGNFVVVWDSYQDGHGSGVFAQRYDSAGSPLGGEFQVNTFTLDNQGYGGNGDGGVRGVAVATDAAGNFVIAWDSGYSDYPQDGHYWGIFAQRYDSSGTPVGAEFQVNTYTTGSQTPGALAADPAGGFVVVWGSEYQDGNDGHGVFGQRFQAIVPPAPIPALSASGTVVLGALLTFAMGWARRRRLGSDSRVS